jgi:hypothetical protein
MQALLSSILSQFAGSSRQALLMSWYPVTQAEHPVAEREAHFSTEGAQTARVPVVEERMV